ILELRNNEKIAATIRAQSKRSGTAPNTADNTGDENLHVVLVTRSGIVKKSNLSDYRNVRKGGIIAIQIEPEDRLIDAKMKTGDRTGNVVGALTVRDDDELMLITTKGQLVRTRVKEIRETGRNAMGVKLLTLREGEKLQAIAPVVSQAEEAQAEAEAVPVA